MKLGILVVYLAGKEDEALLDLHLAQIQKCTHAPYAIYAAVNRLLPRYLDKLKQHPEIKICDCPGTPLRIRDEHAHYLRHLANAAIADGATHLVTLHVDSFPIFDGWERQLAARLSPDCAFATVEKGYTACLFFSRDFYLRHAPEFLVPPDLCGADFDVFAQEEPYHRDSGGGFLWSARVAGLNWHVMSRVAIDDSGFGEVHDGLIFHFVAAARMAQEPPAYLRYTRTQVRMIRLLRAAMRFCPRPLSETIRKCHPQFDEWLAVKHHRVFTAQKAFHLKRRIAGNPEKYLELIGATNNTPRQ